jgi:hypothetical protein
MKSFKIYLLALASVIVLIACNETTTPTDNAKPVAPTALKANSTNATTVDLIFTASTSESDALFDRYILTVTDGVTEVLKDTLLKGQNMVSISGLDEGTIYDFSVKAKFTNGEFSSVATIKWSPATRFIKNNNDSEIFVYESASDFGSGLQLFYATDKAPRIRKVSAGADWDLGLYTTGGKLLFGSASKLGYTSLVGTPGVTEISKVIEADALGNVYDSEAMNAASNTWSEKAIDLSTYTTANKSLVLYVREKNGATYNYAKVQIVKVNTSFLSTVGGPNNRYIKLFISYQTKADVPFAKFPTKY